jgi:hypothetical protein
MIFMLYTSIYILKSILIDMKLITQIKILTITSSLPRQVNQNPNIVRVGESLVEHREQQHIKELDKKIDTSRRLKLQFATV